MCAHYATSWQLCVAGEQAHKSGREAMKRGAGVVGGRRLSENAEASRFLKPIELQIALAANLAGNPNPLPVAPGDGSDNPVAKAVTPSSGFPIRTTGPGFAKTGGH